MTTTEKAPVRTDGPPLGTRIAVEALGSFFIVFAGLATTLFSPSVSTIAFAYGLALMAAIIAFGHVSNGYFNPAFSLAMAVAGRVKWLHAVLYMVAQVLGALLSAVVLYAVVTVMPAEATGGIAKVFGTLANGYDAHSPSQVPMAGVLIVEIVATALLVAVLLGATSARNKSLLAPVAVGVAFAVAVTVTLPISGGSLNPARATAVVFLAGSWAPGQLWLFWLAPLFGAALAAAIHRSFAGTAAPALPATPVTDDAGTPAAADPASASSAAKAPAAEASVAKDAKQATDKVGAVKAGAAKGGTAKKSDAQEFFDAP